MINEAMKEYAEKIHDKEKNYNKILSKWKGVSNMKITIKKIINIAAVFIIVIFIGTISTRIYAKIQWDIQFKEYQNRQVGEGKGTLELAKENGYAEILDMDYLTQDGISVKVDSLLITDDCFDANISFKFAEDIKVDSRFFSYGYAIYDENNNVYSIFSRMHMNSKDNFDYTTVFMLKEIKGNYDKKHIYSEILSDSSNLEIIEANSEDRTITTNFSVRAKDSFPKSKKIYIRIFDLGYTMVDTSEKDGITKIESTEDFVLSDAEWRFEIDVPNKFYERDTIELKLEKDIPELEIEKITLTEVGLVVNFKSKEYYDLIMNGKDMGAEKIQELSKEMLNITNGEGKVYQELSVGTTGEKEGFKITYDAGKVDLNKKLFINFKINDIQYTSELIEK